nr:zinc finger, CCHC-type [Tanacetum cinerariifolium]
MGDTNPIRTLGDYSKPSHEGYRNTIELPIGNNVLPLRSDTIRLMQNRCSFHGLRCAEGSWALLEDFALYDNKTWNDPRDFAKPVKYYMKNPEQAFVDYTSSRTNGTRSRQFAMNQGPRNFNEAANTWKEKPNFNWVYSQTFTSPRNGSFYTYSSSYQTNLEKALIDFDSHKEKRLSNLRTQLGQQQDGMISKINLLWKFVSKKLDDTPIRNTARNPASQMNFTSTNDLRREELQGKGIKIPSKLLFLKYLSRTTEYEDHEMTVESEEEFKKETKDEIKEEKEDSLKHFDTLHTIKELRIPFSTFLLAVLKYFKVHISQLVPLLTLSFPSQQDHRKYKEEDEMKMRKNLEREIN